jgi:hypothetical protein
MNIISNIDTLSQSENSFTTTYNGYDPLICHNFNGGGSIRISTLWWDFKAIRDVSREPAYFVTWTCEGGLGVVSSFQSCHKEVVPGECAKVVSSCLSKSFHHLQRSSLPSGSLICGVSVIPQLYMDPLKMPG